MNVTNADGYEFSACGASNNASIDWGDGTIDNIPDGNPDGSDDVCRHGITHNYAIVGDYTIKIYGDYHSTNSYPPLYFYLLDNFGEISSTSTIISWGTYDIEGIKLPEDIIAVPNSIPSTLTMTKSMFNGAASFNQDLSGWDTSNVTDMSNMFYDAVEFNGNISTWNTSNVTDMSYMFNGATVFNQNISSWNVSNVTYMKGMFWDAQAFNQDISSWDTSNVTDMISMFQNASTFNKDLSGWCVTNIASLPTNFDTGASSWILPRPVWGTCP